MNGNTSIPFAMTASTTTNYTDYIDWGWGGGIWGVMDSWRDSRFDKWRMMACQKPRTIVITKGHRVRVRRATTKLVNAG